MQEEPLANKLILLSLKTQYFEKHCAGTPVTETQQAINFVDYPDSGDDDDDSDENGGVRLISSKPAPMTIGDSADEASAVVGAEAWASAGTTAVVAAAEASAGIAVAGLEPGAEPETTLVNLAPAPAHTTQRTRLAMAVTPKSTTNYA